MGVVEAAETDSYHIATKIGAKCPLPALSAPRQQVLHRVVVPIATARRPHAAVVQCLGDGTEAGHTRRLQLPHDRQHFRREAYVLTARPPPIAFNSATCSPTFIARK
jgi:hypothetical protein